MKTKRVTKLKSHAAKILNQSETSRVTLLEGIARGETAIKEGRSLTHKQAKQRMSKWIK